MALETEGKLHKVFDIEQKTDSFRTREFVIELSGQYPQYIKFQLTQDKCEMIDPYKEGQMLKVFFDLRGRQWQDKFFTNLQAWRIEAAGESQPAPMPAREGAQRSNGGDTKTEDVFDQPSTTADDFDDLPF